MRVSYMQIVAQWLRTLPKKQEAKRDPFAMSTSVEMMSDSLIYQDSKNKDNRDQDYEEEFEEEFEEEVCSCTCMFTPYIVFVLVYLYVCVYRTRSLLEPRLRSKPMIASITNRRSNRASKFSKRTTTVVVVIVRLG